MQLPNFATVADFVAWEEGQPERYEFADGEVSLFPGATARHEIIVVNLCLALRTVAQPHQVRGSNLKVLTSSSSRYADVTVSFDERDAVALRYAQFPALVVEAISPSTQSVDRGPKFDEYRLIDTLREYVLVDSRKRWVQTVRRSGGDWITSLPLRDGTVRFDSAGLELGFDSLYAGTGL
jgi:Uma2 family endonuclease